MYFIMRPFLSFRLNGRRSFRASGIKYHKAAAVLLSKSTHNINLILYVKQASPTECQLAIEYKKSIQLLYYNGFEHTI